MSLLVAVVLGVVEGVFMFVPVSSTSHLVLTQTLLREWGVAMPAPDSPEMVRFNIVWAGLRLLEQARFQMFG